MLKLQNLANPGSYFSKTPNCSCALVVPLDPFAVLFGTAPNLPSPLTSHFQPGTRSWVLITDEWAVGGRAS